ncbi:MAG: hypothetical protein AAF411_23195, partial [Myxococcota bacterium]
MQSRLTLLLLLPLVLTACGRSLLDDFSDGSIPDGAIPDGGVPDGFIDMQRDDGPPPFCETDGECDDGLACNGQEFCNMGGCVPGPGIACVDDGIDCTVEACSEPTGECVSVPDSNLCPPRQICEPGVGCVERACGGDADCDDGLVCNGRELCEGGVCVATPGPVCDDGIDCTLDQCSEAAGGCAIAGFDNRRCDNGRFCDGAEVCTPGGCQRGVPVRCDDGVECQRHHSVDDHLIVVHEELL